MSIRQLGQLGVAVAVGALISAALMAKFQSRETQNPSPPSVDHPNANGRASQKPMQLPGTPVVPADPAVDAKSPAELAFLRGQLTTYEGVPQPWPVGVSAAFTQANLQDTLSRVWQGRAQIEMLDCEEYPCIVRLRLPDGTTTCCTELQALLPDGMQGNMGAGFVQFAEDETAEALISFGDPRKWDPDAETRTRWRVNTWSQELADEAVARRKPTNSGQ